MQKTIILIFSVQSSKINILITLNYFLAEAEGFFSPAVESLLFKGLRVKIKYKINIQM